MLVNLQEILEACEVLGWFSDQGLALAEDKREGVAMALHMSVARLYLLEYLKHLQDGPEPYDALLSASRGELKLGPELVKAMAGSPKRHR